MRLTLLLLACASLPAAGQGLFESHTDVGENPKAGSVEFDASTREYRITGGGANIWGTTDAFQYVWKKLPGDVVVTADIRFLGDGVNPHRKAGIMIRQSLDPRSAYADAMVHGAGLTSLQFRPSAGAVTQESQSELQAPVRIRLERKGNLFTMYAGNPGAELHSTGPVGVALDNPVYIGLAVCSHDANVLETAVFSNVTIETPAPVRPPVRSKISIYNLKDRSTQVVYTADKVFEAPNWSPDGKYLLVNSGGSLYKLAVDSTAAQPEKIDLVSIAGINNDHGISPDGKLIALSARSSGASGSQVYLASSDGSNAHLMTPQAPSYYHGWSPDGNWLAYTAQRNGNFDIFRIPVEGGEEERLTSSPGYDDGPDYSPDGQWIYINSDRSGRFQIWRLPGSGAGPDDQKAERVTNDDYEDWFPHPSPNGKWMVFISFPKGTKGHPANQNVELRMMPLPGAKLKPAKVEVPVKLFGGQGTVNVNSWSPDSKRFAFVSYELLPQRPKILGLAHIALFAHDFEKSRAFYRDFLGFEEPYSLQNADGSPSMTFFKINERQYIELFPERTPGTDRLSHVSLQTDDAEAMRHYLASRGVHVPDRVGKGRIGNSNFNIADPEGHQVEIVQYEPSGWTVSAQGKHLPSTRASDRLLHAGIIVTHLDPEMRFYTEVLGFREIWRGSKDNQELSWINLKAPESDDYLELMLYPEAPAATARGSAHHLCLAVPDIQAAVASLKARPGSGSYARPMELKTGINRKRQVNLFDPDGTRTELMEPFTIDGQPAPSSTAPPPTPASPPAAR